MAAPNVEIRIFERGKLVDVRREHNIWTDRGRTYLAHMISCSLFDPDTPERVERVRYFGVGIGGFQASPAANAAPYSTAYPVGSDPNATTGDKYREDFPTNPLITTLERPVRVSGGSSAYPGAGSDVWLVDTPNFYVTHITPYDLTVHAVIDGTAGAVAYGSFTAVPLSEAGLFLDESTVNINTPYNTLVAYITFGTITLTPDVTVEFIWSIRF